MSVSNTIDLKDIKDKLYERLKPSGWADKLKTFLLSEDFDKILTTLYSEAKSGHRFTPPLKKVFRAFEECPYNDLKVIVIGQDPYPKLDAADGIAFSCSEGRIQSSLKYIFKEIEDTVYKEGYQWDPDLARWSKQGVLMLNTALTTRVNEVGSHYSIWQPFIAFLLDILTFQNPGLVYIFMGRKAEAWAESVPDNNFKLFTTHPASAVHTKNERWDSKDVFNKVSEILWKQYKQRILW
jgi:uracil-DNA glycosylase